MSSIIIWVSPSGSDTIDFGHRGLRENFPFLSLQKAAQHMRDHFGGEEYAELTDDLVKESNFFELEVEGDGSVSDATLEAFKATAGTDSWNYTISPGEGDFSGKWVRDSTGDVEVIDTVYIALSKAAEDSGVADKWTFFSETDVDLKTQNFLIVNLKGLNENPVDGERDKVRLVLKSPSAILMNGYSTIEDISFEKTKDEGEEPVQGDTNWIWPYDASAASPWADADKAGKRYLVDLIDPAMTTDDPPGEISDSLSFFWDGNFGGTYPQYYKRPDAQGISQIVNYEDIPSDDPFRDTIGNAPNFFFPFDISSKGYVGATEWSEGDAVPEGKAVIEVQGPFTGKEDDGEFYGVQLLPASAWSEDSDDDSAEIDPGPFFKFTGPGADSFDPTPVDGTVPLSEYQKLILGGGQGADCFFCDFGIYSDPQTGHGGLYPWSADDVAAYGQLTQASEAFNYKDVAVIGYPGEDKWQDIYFTDVYCNLERLLKFEGTIRVFDRRDVFRPTFDREPTAIRSELGVENLNLFRFSLAGELGADDPGGNPVLLLKGIGSTANVVNDKTAHPFILNESDASVFFWNKALGGGRGSSGNCFIAGYAYKDDPENSDLDALRSFRDGYLSKSRTGRAAIRAYYKTAPTAVRAFDRVPSARPIVKAALSQLVVPFVKKLK